MVKDLTTDGVDNALRNLSSGMQITGGTIRGGRTGMDLQAGTTVNGIQVGLTTTGIRARAAEPIALDAVTVDAVSRRRRVPAGKRGHAARLVGARAWRPSAVR